uniref:PHB domain-containing protein n=1 Tax=Macrostomum lignano TaxID=282301 RepID=A0A1I8IJL7_9PLAT
TVGFCSRLLYICSLALVLLTLPFSLLFCLRVVAEYERAVLFRLGRVSGSRARGPGLFFTAPCCDTVRIVDLRTVTFDVPPQEVLTKDSVTVAVDAVVYYRIFNPVISVINVENADRSTRLLAQTTLRNVLGTKNLSEILAEREDISCLMQESLDAATDPWGVKVERVEIKDVRLPVQLQRAMAAEAEAAREARAKVIMAEGERRASRALREAASVIQQSPSALQLRYLHTVSAISAENNSTAPWISEPCGGCPPSRSGLMDELQSKTATAHDFMAPSQPHYSCRAALISFISDFFVEILSIPLQRVRDALDLRALHLALHIVDGGGEQQDADYQRHQEESKTFDAGPEGEHQHLEVGGVLGELEHPDEADNSQEGQRGARLRALAAHGDQHIGEGDIVRHDGREIHRILHILDEGLLARADDETDQQFNGEPGGAGRLDDEEGVEEIRQLPLGAVRVFELLERLGAEEDDGGHGEQHRQDGHHEGHGAGLRVLEQHPDGPLQRVLGQHHSLRDVAFILLIGLNNFALDVVEFQLGQEDVISNSWRSFQLAAVLIVVEHGLEGGAVPVQEVLPPGLVVVHRPTLRVAQQGARVLVEDAQAGLEVHAGNVQANPLAAHQMTVVQRSWRAADHDVLLLLLLLLLLPLAAIVWLVGRAIH